ncbi:MAG: Tetratricopeptide 2 repeat protein [Phycisphaerales bacterium]|nr:Tetratricopeptide 2 repeat protein [Phycisphaerales bacterium]MDB5357393.1 Tetratricopeptide 2 repeat protein [Phycisphaerales bacterium]
MPIPLTTTLRFAIALGIACAGLPGCQSGRGTPPPSSVSNTDLARQYNDRAFKLIAAGDYDQAEPILQQALGADPTFGPIRNNLGLVAFHRGDLYRASWEFENAIKLMPRQPEPRNNLGLALEKAGKLNDAIDAYTRALEMNPNNSEYLGNLARARVRRGDRDATLIRQLQDISLKDPRPAWRDWAKLNATRLASPESVDPTSRPSAGRQ